jgi:hypothetical protein
MPSSCKFMVINCIRNIEKNEEQVKLLLKPKDSIIKANRIPVFVTKLFLNDSNWI